MTTHANPSPPSDEAHVESIVRALLKQLDAELETGNNWGCSIAGLVLAPAVFFSLWWGLEWSLGLVLLPAVVGPLVLWVLFWTTYDGQAIGRAATTFNRNFPAGHPDRELAVRMLDEMPYSNRGNEKLRVRLGESRA